MAYSGQAFVNAPREKVWNALLDADTLSACFAAPGMVRKVAEGAFELGAPISRRVTLLSAQPPSALSYTAQDGSLNVTLAEDGPQMTRLAYVLEAPARAGMEQQVASVLDAFKAGVAGPREIGAGGLANAQAAGTE